MFHDYIPLLLVNMTAGLVILAGFFWKGYDSPAEKAWTPGLAIVGLVATVVGLHMALTWPIPETENVNLMFANVAFGETSVMFGVLFLGAALAVAKGWSLAPVAIYGAIAGLIAIVIGIRIQVLEITQSPPMTCAGFVLTGLAGVAVLAIVLAPVTLARMLKVLAGLVMIVAAAIWALTATVAYWGHLKHFSGL
jgi:putative membrane protein